MTITRTDLACFLGGLLVGNSAPHLGTFAAGKEHLTPLAGRHSSPTVNLLWGAANLLGGLGVVAAAGGRGRPRWDRRLTAFEAGVTTFAAWMLISENVWQVNSDRLRRARPRRPAPPRRRGGRR